MSVLVAFLFIHGEGRGFIVYMIHLLLVFVFTVHGQPDFLNIDCGKPRGYNGSDSLTGLLYESDYDYIETGVTQSISSVFQGPTVPSQANDLRSFPNGTRNCYSLTPVTPGKKYLIRASFLYGNYDGKSYFPKFDLYLGTIPWETISISSLSAIRETTIYSVASSNFIFVCLLDVGSGTPFISNLELRPLDDDVYTLVNASNSISLVLGILVNFEASTDPVVRYPKDAYDRVWRSYGDPSWTKLYTSLGVSTSDGYDPPSTVMQTAVAPTSGSTLNFSITFDDDPTKYHIFSHFAELEVLSQSASRIFSMSWNGMNVYENIRPSYLLIFTVFTSQPRHFENNLNYSLYMTNGSTLPPLINAIEVYKVRESEQVTTRIEDAEAIRDIKAFYHLKKNWTGDPCAPREFTWDGLVCSYTGSPRITALNLRASGLTGTLRVSISSLTELQEFIYINKVLLTSFLNKKNFFIRPLYCLIATRDLSINELTGPIPKFLAELQQLKLLNLTNSGLKGPVPNVLLNRSKNGSLELSFEDNPNSSGTSTDTPSLETKQKSNVLVIAITTSFSLALLVLLVVGISWKLASHKHHKQHSLGSLQEDRNILEMKPDQSGTPLTYSDFRQFTYSELAIITKNFNHKIGEGGFGSVYYGISPNKVPVAVKMLSPASCQGPKEFQWEAQLLTKINHRNLVPFVGYCNDENHLALVYEYMAQGNLAIHLSGEAHPLCWKDRIRIATEAALGLEYLHKRCTLTIIHRDIKTSNILLDQNLEAKIGDFGLSRACNNDTFTQVTTAIMGTRGYLDPFSIILDQRSDVYAFGVVLMELITGRPAIINGEGSICITEWVKEHFIRGDQLDSIVDKQFMGNYNSKAVWKALVTAIACVSSDTNGRPDMTRVLDHLKDCLEMECVNFTTSNESSTMASNFTSELFRSGNDSKVISPSVR